MMDKMRRLVFSAENLAQSAKTDTARERARGAKRRRVLVVRPVD